MMFCIIEDDVCIKIVVKVIEDEWLFVLRYCLY